MSTFRPIYKFCPFNINSLRILTNTRFYLGSPQYFNDLFEGEFAIVSLKEMPDSDVLKNYCIPRNINFNSIKLDELNSQIKKEIRTQLQSQFGISCFTASPNNQLMWAHYAESLKGFCIQFDEDILIEQIKNYTLLDESISICKVSYSDVLPKVMYEFLNGNIQYYFEDSELYHFKNKAWEYEQEKRIIWRIPDHFKSREIAFDASSIKKVIVGEMMSNENQDFLCNLIRQNKNLSHVEIYETEKNLAKNFIGEKSFPLIYPRIQYFSKG